MRIPSPGSSLTVFFVDLHQGLVGLLCSCQTVLRLGRGSRQVRPWPAAALLPPPSMNRHPETQTCAVNIKAPPPVGPSGLQSHCLPFPDLCPPRSLRQPPRPRPSPVPTMVSQAHASDASSARPLREGDLGTWLQPVEQPQLLTLLAPNCTRAFPFTSVALICMITDSIE